MAHAGSRSNQRAYNATVSKNRTFGAIAPGLIATDSLFAGFPDAEVQTAVQQYIPGGRFGLPAELAAAILFVASDDASYLNGAIVPVDGGLGGREAGPVMKPRTEQVQP